MGLSLVTPPEEMPVTLEEVKAQLSIQDADEDAMLESLIEAATAFFDGPNGDLCGRALKPQTWDLYLDQFPSNDKPIRIPLPPLISVESVNYIDPDTGNEVVLGVDEYEVDAVGTPFGWVAPADSSWPSTMETVNAVRVRFVAGYADNEDESPAETTVPKGIRQAIILLVQDMYGKGSAFVDKTQTPNLVAIEALTKHYVIKTV